MFGDSFLTPLAIDLLTLAAILFFTWRCWRKGFFIGLSGFFALGMSLVLALAFYRFVSAPLVSLGMGRQWAGAVGLVIVFMTCEQPLYWWWRKRLSWLIGKWSRPRRFVWVNIPFALLEGCLMAIIILTALQSLPLKTQERRAFLDSQVASRLIEQAVRLDRKISSVFSSDGQTLTFYTVSGEKERGRVRSLGFTVAHANPSLKHEVESMDLVNQARENQGVPKLRFDPELLGLARGHGADMLSRGYFSHVSPEGKDVVDRAVESDVMFLVVAENLALSGSVETAHEGLMNSVSHRTNILSPLFNRFAVGVLDAGRHGLLFVQVFAH